VNRLCWDEAMKLDLRLRGATVLTIDPARPLASALGIWRGRIVGLDEDVTDLPAEHEIDLNGATVLPGFVDGHVHLAWTGLRMQRPDLTPAIATGSLDTVLRAVRHAALQVPVGEWVDIVGYDQRPLGRHLTAGELDAVGEGRKLFLTHDSGHACVVNGGVVALLPPGTPHDDGLLVEDGMAVARELRMPYSVRELVDAVERAALTCRSEGVTTVAEAGIGGGLAHMSPVELAVFQAALEQGRLPVRVQAMVVAAALHPVRAHQHDAIAEALDLGLRTGLGGDRLSVGALKIWSDGGMMARTAKLSSPYLNPDGTPTDNSGRFFTEPEVLIKQIIEGHRAGWQLAVHAIGDAAVDLALEGIERAQAVHPRPQARHRIEHAGLVRPDQLDRFARLRVAAVVQPAFLWYLGDDYAAIMGEERASWLYRGQAFLRHRIRLVGSSDRPVTAGAPLRAIQAMVERVSSGGRAIGPDEAMSVDDALRAYTWDAAWALHLEHSVGSLEPGKQADLVMLAEDPRAVSPSRIAGIQVLTTYLAGEAL
jgi:predicted amidohydrolase YtcJ